MKYVILDIETTGLDRERSSVLEIGAILVSGDVIVDHFSSFVQYRDEIPETIHRLTGITEEMVRDAPPVGEVIKKARSFIKGYPVVSHYGFSFDFPILERDGLKFDQKYDSIEFAFFMLPTNAYGHSMRVLTEYFDLEPVPHRALKDCELEFEVIKKLQEVYTKKPAKQRASLKYIADRVGWWWRDFLTEKSEEIIDISTLVDPFEPYRKSVSEETVAVKTKGVDVQGVEKLFSPGQGSGSSAGDYSEDRPEQKKMAAIITNSFNTKTHAVIEAGTGTGKSKAYLVPSVLFALKNDISVIISTHTKALQDQLFFKEIPHLRTIIEKDLRVAVLKGKKNYVCLLKFKDFVENVIIESSQRSLYFFRKEDVGFTRQLACLLLTSWALETKRGDWDELPYWFKERIPKRVEYDICNTDELCTKGVCELHDEQKCFLVKARLRAKDADIAIVNHAIVLSGIIVPTNEEELPLIDEDSDTSSEQQHSFTHTLFPGEAKFIVFDEAHYLEDDATSAWEHVFTKTIFELLQQQIFGREKRRGVVNIIKSITRAKEDQRLVGLAESFYAIEDALRLDINALFENILPELVAEPGEDKYSQHEPFSEISGSELNILKDILTQIKDRLETVKTTLKAFSKETDVSQQEKILIIRARSIRKIIKSIYIITDTDGAYVRYLERTDSSIEMKAALLSVAEDLCERVYNNFSSVILTSATLTVDKRFDFFANRCGVRLMEKDRITFSHLLSSFDYKRQVQFLLPEHISYRALKKEKHFEESVRFLEQAIIASGGGALILCTSFEQVNWIYERLIHPLSKKNIWLLKQERGSSPTSVIRDFTSDINSVLVGTETLWHGVDVPGKSLRVLFIYKILYRVPKLPLIAARRDELDKKGQNGFTDYYEPLAAMTLKQGFGRLIRKKTDTGIVVMLDDRLLGRPRLVNSLPKGVVPKRVEAEKIYIALKKLAKASLPPRVD
ncbi:ribonuclease H-like domain-containing protein [Patescibacteria group bacterium AH-259-L07]|nr:ribonuclease H-like domain-containing protein [Patescibacteria group bacterium AH-259-L07]